MELVSRVGTQGGGLIVGAVYHENHGVEMNEVIK